MSRLHEAAEAVVAKAQLMPVQLFDERGIVMGFSTYACVEVPLMNALMVALEDDVLTALPSKAANGEEMQADWERGD